MKNVNPHVGYFWKTVMAEMTIPIILVTINELGRGLTFIS